jgi:hypothetical protein
MNCYRRIFLGSAAFLCAGVGVQAADLPSRKAAPVQYVKICDAYGASFFFIPGADTCLRVGGYVRAQYQYQPGQKIINAADGSTSQSAKAQDTTGTEFRGRIDLDARTRTSWQTVQTVIRLRATNRDGVRNVAGTSNFMPAYLPGGNGTSTLTMERAFIRFSGFTAGVAEENFTTMPGYLYSGNLYAGFPSGVKQLAYTATFGGGLSATFAIESRGDLGNDTQTGFNVPPSAVPTAANSTYVNRFDTGYDLVGNVREDQKWGYFQLSGAIGNNTTSTQPSANYNPKFGPHKYGAYVVGLSFRYNLPFIAPGDQFNFQTEFGHGMDGLVLSTGGLSDVSNSSNKRFLGGVVRADSNLTPTSVDAGGTPLAYGQEDAWAVFGLFTHYWSPTWRSNVGGGYAQFTPPAARANLTGCIFATGAGCKGLNTQWGRGKIAQIAGNLVWSPTKDFDMGFELEYLHLASTLQNPSAAFIAAHEPGLIEDGVGAKLRLQRTF